MADLNIEQLMNNSEAMRMLKIGNPERSEDFDIPKLDVGLFDIERQLKEPLKNALYNSPDPNGTIAKFDTALMLNNLGIDLDTAHKMADMGYMSTATGINTKDKNYFEALKTTAQHAWWQEMKGTTTSLYRMTGNYDFLKYANEYQGKVDSNPLFNEYGGFGDLVLSGVQPTMSSLKFIATSLLLSWLPGGIGLATGSKALKGVAKAGGIVAKGVNFVSAGLSQAGNVLYDVINTEDAEGNKLPWDSPVGGVMFYGLAGIMGAVELGSMEMFPWYRELNKHFTKDVLAQHIQKGMIPAIKSFFWKGSKGTVAEALEEGVQSLFGAGFENALKAMANKDGSKFELDSLGDTIKQAAKETYEAGKRMFLTSFLTAGGGQIAYSTKMSLESKRNFTKTKTSISIDPFFVNIPKATEQTTEQGESSQEADTPTKESTPKKKEKENLESIEPIQTVRVGGRLIPTNETELEKVRTAQERGAKVLEVEISEEIPVSSADQTTLTHQAALATEGKILNENTVVYEDQGSLNFAMYMLAPNIEAITKTDDGITLTLRNEEGTISTLNLALAQEGMELSDPDLAYVEDETAPYSLSRMKEEQAYKWHERELVKSRIGDIVGHTKGKVSSADLEANVDATILVANTLNIPTDELLEKNVIINLADTVVTPEGKEARGSIEQNVIDGKKQYVITLSKKADVSTLLHELGHTLRGLATPEQLIDFKQHYGSEELETAFLDDIQHVDGKFNVANKVFATYEEASDYVNQFEERFADDFVAYLRTGQAPTTELTNIFSRMKAVLSKLIREFGDRLTPEVKEAFDNLIAGKAGSNTAGISDAQGNVIYQGAYHGTGGSFNRFDPEFMGDGEGSQAYGWGFYLSSSFDVSNNYRVIASYNPDNQRINGRNITDEYDRIDNMASKSNSPDWLYEVLEGLESLMMHETRKTVIEQLKENGADKRAIKYFQEAKYKTFGNVYNTSFSDDLNIVDYYKKLTNEQYSKLIAALEKLGVEQDNEEYMEDMVNALSPNMNASTIYGIIAGTMEEDADSKKATSEFFDSVGINGFSYPVTLPSGKESDTDVNYVIFNPDNIKIESPVLFQQAPSVDSQAFKEWFGDSNVVDENGVPMVVYHGTASQFSVFAEDSGVTRFGKGFSFTNGYGVAEDFANSRSELLGSEKRIIEAFLSLRKPFDITDDIDSNTIEAKNLIKLLKDQYGLDEKYTKQVLRRENGGRDDTFNTLSKKIFDEQSDESSMFFAGSPEKFRSLLEQAGYDGIIAKYSDVNEYFAFTSNQIKSVNNQGTFDSNNPNILYQLSKEVVLNDSSVDSSFYGGTFNQKEWRKKLELPLEGKISVNQLGHALTAYHKKIAKGKDLSADTKANVKLHADRIAKIVGSRLKSTGLDAIGWYDKQLSTAMSIFSIAYPELETNLNMQTIFKVSLAITSQGQDLYTNANLASTVYEYYKKKKKFPTQQSIVNADKSDAMVKNFSRANELIKKTRSIENFKSLILRYYSVGQISRAVDQLSGENINGVLPIAAVFGSKIGGGFLVNLFGDYTQFTMDLWITRLLGRITGTLSDGTSVETIMRNLEEFKTLIKGVSDISLLIDVDGDVVQQLKIGDLTKEAILEDEDALMEYAKIVKNAYGKKRDYKGITGSYHKKLRTEYAKKAKTLIESYGIKGAPTQREKTYWRKIVNESAEVLYKEGINITIADIQAILWYSEKDIYSAFGTSTKKSESASYIDAAKEMIYNKLGRGEDVNERINQASLRRGSEESTSRSNGYDSGTEGFEGIHGKRIGQDQTSSSGEGIQQRGFRGRNSNESVGSKAYSRRVLQLSSDSLIVNGSKVDAIAEFEPDSLFSYFIKDKFNSEANKIYEINNPQAFHDAIKAGAESLGLDGITVKVKSAEDYKNMRMFITDGGLSGFALDGVDIVSVFRHKDAPRKVSYSLIALAISEGGRTLDCFDLYLPSLYSKFGFSAKSRVAWDEGQAPKNWDYEKYGRPDVVLMTYTLGDPDVSWVAFRDKTSNKYYKPTDGILKGDWDSAAKVRDAATDMSKKHEGSGKILFQLSPEAKQQLLDIRKDEVKTAVENFFYIPQDVLEEYAGEEWADDEIRFRSYLTQYPWILEEARNFADTDEFLTFIKANIQVGDYNWVLEDELWFKRVHAYSRIQDPKAKDAQFARLNTGTDKALISLGKQLRGYSDVDYKGNTNRRNYDGGFVRYHWGSFKGVSTKVKMLNADSTAEEFQEARKLINENPRPYRKAMQVVEAASERVQGMKGYIDNGDVGRDAYYDALGEEMEKDLNDEVLINEMTDREAAEFLRTTKDSKERYTAREKLATHKGVLAMEQQANAEVKRLGAEKDKDIKKLEDQYKRSTLERNVLLENLQKEREAAKEALSQLKDEQKQSKKLGENLEKSRERATRARSYLTNRKARVTELRTQLTAKNQEVKNLKNRVDSLKKRIDDAKLKEKLEKLHKKILATVNFNSDSIDASFEESFRTIHALFEQDQRVGAFQHIPEQMSQYISDERLTWVRQGKKISSWELGDLLDLYEAAQLMRSDAKVMLETKKVNRMGRLQNISAQMYKQQYGVMPEIGVGYGNLMNDIIDDLTQNREGYDENIFEAIFHTVKSAIGKMQRIARVIDGNKEGIAYQLLVRDAYDRMTEELRESYRRLTEADKMMKHLEITSETLVKNSFDYTTTAGQKKTLTKGEVIGLYVYSQNQIGTQKLVHNRGNNIAPYDLARAIGSLSENEKAWGDYMIDNLGGDEVWERMNDTYYEVYNKNLGRRKRYFTFIADGVKDEGNMDIINGVMRNTIRYVDKGMTKEVEVHAIYPLKLNVTHTFTSQVKRQEHFIQFADWVRDMNYLLNKGAVGRIIDMNHGQKYLKMVQEYVNEVGSPQVILDDIEKIGSKIVSNAAVAALSLNFLTMLKQLPSFSAALRGDIGAVELTQVALRLSNPKTHAQAVKFIHEMSPYMLKRSVSVEVEKYNASDYNTFVGRKIQGFNEKIGMKGIQLMDQAAVNTLWLAAYDTYIRRNQDVMSGSALRKEAAFRATQLISETQPTSIANDLSSLQRKKSPWVRAALLFSNQLFQYVNMVWYDMPTAAKAFIDTKNPKELKKFFAIFTNMAVSGAMIMLVSGAFFRRDHEDDDDYWKRIGQEVGKMIASYTLPIVGGDVGQGISGWAFGGDLVDLPSSFGRMLGADWRDLDNISDRAWDLLDGVASVGALPTAFINRAVKSVKGVNPFELLGSVYGDLWEKWYE